MSEAREDTRVGLIGKTIGRYRVTAELGRGGMATVYRAHDPQLGRDVAIKIMHGAFAGRGDLEARFRREARAVASIKHDGIVNVFDFAPASAGEPGYIVTEIVEGPTLRTVVECNRGRLLPEIATLVAARIAGALGAAHARGIVHRDVKPDNVMFDLAGGAMRVLLTDFGIARMTEVDTMTVTGAIVGSPIYMSPEQTRGQEIGPASDVFSLGVLLYQVITGRPPFAGRDPMTAIAAIQRGEFLRPSQVDAHVGPALEAVILRCLQRLPATRFPDGQALEAALSEIARDVQRTLDLTEGNEVLRRFFDDIPAGEHQRHPRAGTGTGTGSGAGASTSPGAFIAGLSARVAEQAFEQAKEHARRRELARALGETNRVFAYAPDHAGAQALLAGIARRRRTGKVAAVAAMLFALVAAGAGTQRWLVARRAQTRSAPVSLVNTSSTAAPFPGGDRPPAEANGDRKPETLARRQVAAPTTQARPPAAVTATATAALPEPGARPHAASSAHPIRAPARAQATVPGRARALTPGAAAGLPIAAAASPSVNEPSRAPAPVATTAPMPALTPAAAASPAPSPAAAPPRPPAATASLALRASQGFCSPSMDDQPASIHPSYERVTPGLHHLFCTLPGGPKTFVGNYDLRAGTKPNLVIVPGPDGKPMLSRPE